MIVVLKPGVPEEKRDRLIEWLQSMGMKIHLSVGEFQTIIGLIGDSSNIDVDLIESLDIVDSVKVVTETFKQVNRKFHPDDLYIDRISI